MCHGLESTLNGGEGSVCTILIHCNISCQYSCYCTIARMNSPMCWHLENKEVSILNLMYSGSETEKWGCCITSSLPTWIPHTCEESRPIQWNVVGRFRAEGSFFLHRLGSEISSWLGHELEAKPQPHFTWPPSPTAMMATVAGTDRYCGAVYCVFF